MDIDETRRLNLAALERAAGSTRAAAERAGMSYAQFVNLRDGAKDSRSGRPRAMRKTTAWRFEDAFGLPRGWMDVDHSDNKPDPALLREPVPAPYLPRSPLELELLRLARGMSERGLHVLLDRAAELAGRYPRGPEAKAA